MPVITKALSAVFVKVEATEGTDAVPTGGDAVQLIEHAVLSYGHEIQNEQTDLDNQLLDEGLPLPPAGKYVDITIKNWIRGAGAAYNNTTIFPEMHAVLQSMGLAAAFGAAIESYDTASTATKAVTVYAFRETDTGAWVKYPILGSRCARAVFTLRAGMPIECEATLRGIFVQPSDGGFITPTYQTTIPPLVGATGTWALGSLAPVLRRATVGLQLNLVPQLNVNAADAISGYKPARRKATFDASFEDARISDYDAFTAWKTAPQSQLVINVGTASNNKFSLTADKATNLLAPAFEDDQGLWLRRISGLLTPEGTNRVKISFGP